MSSETDNHMTHNDAALVMRMLTEPSYRLSSEALADLLREFLDAHGDYCPKCGLGWYMHQTYSGDCKRAKPDLKHIERLLTGDGATTCSTTPRQATATDGAGAPVTQSWGPIPLCSSCECRHSVGSCPR